MYKSAKIVNDESKTMILQRFERDFAQVLRHHVIDENSVVGKDKTFTIFTQLGFGDCNEPAIQSKYEEIWTNLLGTRQHESV